MASGTAQRNRQQNRLNMVLVAFVLIVMLVMVAVNNASLQRKINAKHQEEAAIDLQIADEEKRAEENAEYAKEVQTKGFYEKMAREKLGLVYEGEVLFKEEN